ncbi:MAG TPA: M20/M25/M40 family metallo-hydrolase [Thermoanaerobaculia bacterium]|nr:M20/M25/M40 family metallo-hydrolase [Thermoanaerobaculia bacterium]
MPRPVRSPLAGRRRAAARIALYGSLVLVAGLAVGLLAWLRPSLSLGQATDWIEQDFSGRREVQLLREYIAIDTATGTGDQLAGARWVESYLRGIGLDPVLERVGEEANVWAVVEGRRREAIVLHHHVDVDPVPVDAQWEHPPFAGVIDGPWLYGRGAFDMKSIAVAQLEAVRGLVESGRTPELSVIVLATTGEEVGSDLGTRWVLREHPELVERMAYVLTEGGAVEATAPGQAKYWGTEVAQARPLRVAVCGGSREALERLGRDLVRELGILGEPRLVPEVARVMARYGPTRDAEYLRDLLRDPEALLRDRAGFAELPAYVRWFFTDQIAPQGVHRQPDGTWELRLVALLLPGADPERSLAELLPPWLTAGFEVAVRDEGAASGGSPLDHPAFQAIDRFMARERPDTVHGPLYLPYTLTDARFFRAAGVPTYGFTPFNVLTPDVLRLRTRGSVNERIEVASFVDGVELYRRLLAELTS